MSITINRQGQFYKRGSVLSRLLIIVGEIKTVGEDCQIRPEEPKIEAEGPERRCVSSGGAASSLPSHQVPLNVSLHSSYWGSALSVSDNQCGRLSQLSWSDLAVFPNSLYFPHDDQESG